MQHTSIHCHTSQHTATHLSTPQHSSIHCNTLQHAATHLNTLQHAATHLNTMQHTSIHCNTTQHTATKWGWRLRHRKRWFRKRWIWGNVFRRKADFNRLLSSKIGQLVVNAFEEHLQISVLHLRMSSNIGTKNMSTLCWTALCPRFDASEGVF